MLKEGLKNILLQEAEKAMHHAYSPYSGIKVGAAVLAKNEMIFKGCNVENASFGLTICAERASIFNAIAQGCRDFEAIAVVTDSNQVDSPCGACRQVLLEFNPDLQVIFKKPGKTSHYTAKELLPDGFLLNK